MQFATAGGAEPNVSSDTRVVVRIHGNVARPPLNRGRGRDERQARPAVLHLVEDGPCNGPVALAPIEAGEMPLIASASQSRRGRYRAQWCVADDTAAIERRSYASTRTSWARCEGSFRVGPGAAPHTLPSDGCDTL